MNKAQYFRAKKIGFEVFYKNVMQLDADTLLLLRRLNIYRSELRYYFFKKSLDVIKKNVLDFASDFDVKISDEKAVELSTKIFECHESKKN